MKLAAIIGDTYRSLKARGLFWAVLWINVVIVLIFASLGCDASGWSIFFGLQHFDSSWLVQGSQWERALLLNSVRGIMDWWGSFLALVLALFPAATIFPDTMQPGTIDLYLSKPVGRLRLFLGKYLGGLLFAGVQAAILAAGLFLALWFRLGLTFWSLSWSVGGVVLVFSFVYCFTALIGVLTRSSVAALLWTIVFWFLLWLAQFVEYQLGVASFKEMEKIMGAEGKQLSAAAQGFQSKLEKVMIFLPKTRQVSRLLDRNVRVESPRGWTELLMRGQSSSDEDFVRTSEFLRLEMRASQAQEKSPLYLIGSSLLFEAVLLGLAYWLFARRDF